MNTCSEVKSIIDNSDCFMRNNYIILNETTNYDLNLHFEKSCESLFSNDNNFTLLFFIFLINLIFLLLINMFMCLWHIIMYYYMKTIRD
jgi:hypothetical protein